ncbi:MAG: T9SS type A sorting domain-containing protein [Chitinophagales bacterium]
MKTLKGITTTVLLILCGILMSNTDILAQCSVDAGQDEQICNGQAIFLTATAINGEPPYSYQWNTGENTADIVVSPTENTTYSVTVTDMESCIASDEVVVAVSDMSLSLTNLPMPDCVGAYTEIFSATTGGIAPYAYEWSNGETTNSIMIMLLGNQTYTLTITDAAGCQVEENISFELQDCSVGCDVTLEANEDQQICNGETITLTATANGGNAPYNYAWSTGENTATITVSPTENTTYYVLATDTESCIAYENVVVTVSDLSVDIGMPQIVCLDETVFLSAANIFGGTAPYTYEWSTGETTENISVDGLTYGDHYFGITITDATGCTASDGLIVVVENIGVTPVSVNACATNYLVYHDINDNGQQDADEDVVPATQVSLFDADNNVVTTSASSLGGIVTFQNLEIGSYTVEFDYYSCLVSLPLVLTENCSCDVVVDAGQDQQICAGQTVILTSSINGGNPPYVYSWTTGETTQSITVSPTQSESYGIVVTDADGCNANDNVLVEVSNLNVNLVNQPNSEFPYCIGTEIEVFPNPTGGNTPYVYDWSNGQTTPILNLTLTENVTYTLTVTDINGCFVEESISFEVEDCGACDLMVDLGSDLLICGTESANISSLVSNGTPPYTYDWSEAGMGQSANTAVPNNVSGTYSVTVTDFNGCTATDDIVVVASNLEANIAMEWSEPFCQTDSIIYSAMVSSNNTAPYAYTWWLDGEVISTTESFILVVLKENYDIMLEVIDANGCVVVRESQLIGITCSYVWPGDANNDGIANNNDVLQIGLGYGYEGDERFDALTDWTEQPSTNWETSFEDGLNHNYGDCDGNGIINDDDVAVVDLNYGQVHSKNEGENGGENDIPLFCELPENIISGGSYSLPIKLGNDDIAAEDIYGIAFTINVTMEEDFELLESQINFSNSWLGTEGFDIVTLDKNVSTNQWDIALVRTDHTDISGSGQLCSIDCIMEVGSLKNETALIVPVSVSFSNVTLINAQAAEILTNPITTQAEVISSIGETANNVLQTTVYPNPASDILYIKNPNHENLSITILNVLGQTVAEQQVSANENRSTIAVSHLDSGYYLVRIEEQNQQKTHKLWID